VTAIGAKTTTQQDSERLHERSSTTAILRVGLLGGFRVEVAGVAASAFAWQRLSAKRLTKLLAATPSHAMHREQIFEILWPMASVDSARNSLAKALHAARHALEPERLPRQGSAYLYTRDDMIGLDTDHVLIDADEFQRLAQRALRLTDAPAHETALAYEAALALYRGALLPEDRYEDWPSARRRYLADLNLRLLVGLAEIREIEGDRSGAIDCLEAALLEDQTREDAHRHLMHLYDATGARDLALRQFETCRTHLRRELNRAPHWETMALYEELLANRVPPLTTRRQPRVPRVEVATDRQIAFEVGEGDR
jgi:DNA-binding SARP family transcriptional activator